MNRRLFLFGLTAPVAAACGAHRPVAGPSRSDRSAARPRQLVWPWRRHSREAHGERRALRQEQADGRALRPAVRDPRTRPQPDERSPGGSHDQRPLSERDAQQGADCRRLLRHGRAAAHGRRRRRARRADRPRLALFEFARTSAHRGGWKHGVRWIPRSPHPYPRSADPVTPRLMYDALQLEGD